jgi:hypothetical protein
VLGGENERYLSTVHPMMNRFRKRRASVQKRPRLATIAGLMMLGQSLVLLGFGIYHYLILSMGPELLSLWWRRELIEGGRFSGLVVYLRELFAQAASMDELSILVESLLLMFLALLAIGAGFAFMAQRQRAWFVAMLIQTVLLGLGLTLYYVSKPLHVYVLFIVGIFMVIYLHYVDLVRRPPKQELLGEKDHAAASH